MENDYHTRLQQTKRQAAELLHERDSLTTKLSKTEDMYRMVIQNYNLFQEKHKDCSFISKEKYMEMQEKLSKIEKKNETLIKALERIKAIINNVEHLRQDGNGLTGINNISISDTDSNDELYLL